MTVDYLRSVLADESKAYGFTIAFWGSGTLLITQFGLPGIENVLLYALGAITGFGLISLLAFRSVLKHVKLMRPNFLVASMVHYLAALTPILVTYSLLGLGESYAFFLSGASVSVVYNLLILAEELFFEEIRAIEEKLAG
ncbi:MAG: hypothetical protein SVS85_03360 [Candidatus Nanohaloarchaea archaeon]|nr:hypothetical protein [Candidatus Nanohaloarchaea archaeon]